MSGGSGFYSTVLVSLWLLELQGVSKAAIPYVQIKVPDYRIMGETAELRCSYDGAERLYAVKWYKDNQEFFRYAPGREPEFQVFPNVRGISVDESRSDKHKVSLRRVDLNSTGFYSCEVIGEAPGFHTSKNQAYVRVVVLPHGDPLLSGYKPHYTFGDVIRVNCTSRPSKPVASLKWYINGREADRHQVTDYLPVVTDPGLLTAALGLELDTKVLLDERLTPSELRLNCTATTAEIDYRTAVTRVVVHPRNPPAAMVGTPDVDSRPRAGNRKLTNGSSSTPCPRTAVLLAGILLLFLGR